MQNVWSAAASPPSDQVASGNFADETARRRRILVVDDLEIVRDLLGHYLALAGYEADVVAGGSEAVEAARTKRYDLVLMDIQMPGVDGMATTRLIRGLGAEHAEIPIIAVTANVLPEQTRRYLEAGMNDHVAKPLNRNAILLKVAQWLPNDGPESAVLNVGIGRSDVIFDETTFQEFSQLVGSESAHKWLQRLRQSLQSTFPEGGGRAPCTELVQQLQLLVSQTGTLGFPELSLRLSELEEACLKGRDLTLPWARAANASRLACEVITKTAAVTAAEWERGRGEASGQQE
jgi:CheY-like chemotaxis protein